MRAFLDDPAFVHHDDAVGGAHGRQAVSDDDGGAVRHQSVERVLHQSLTLSVERGSRLIEQQQRSVPQQRARDRDALALAARQARTAFAEEGVEAVGQRVQEIGGIGVARRLPQLLVARVPIAVAQIVASRGGEDHRLLRHHRDALADVGGIGVAQVDPVDQHSAVLRIVEALRELEDRRLAGARWADHREPSRVA